MNEIDKPKEFKMIPQQAEFLTSEKRFVCFCGGIGSGKTLVLLLKGVTFCQKYPGAVVIVIRKNYTDLFDSTLSDFTKYFGLTVDVHKTVVFENGSKMLFRHGSELDLLKNLNIDLALVEQAEEFDDETQFNFLRDRIRGRAAPYQQIAIIANANGHNYIWRKWIYEPASEDYHYIGCTTFDNASNLPPAFVEDMRKREKEEPRHFARMVMNSHDESLADDNVFNSSDIIRATKLGFKLPPFTVYAAGLDVAGFGSDKTCLVILARVGVKRWKMVFMEEKQGKEAPEIVSWVKDTWNTFPFSTIGVDDIGVGWGVQGYLNDSSRYTCYGFTANESPLGVSPYKDKKTDMYFRLEEYVSKDWLELLPDIYLQEELMSVKYFYRGDSDKHIVSKHDMRNKGVKSPNKVEALGIALYYANEDEVIDADEIIIPGVTPSRKKFQEYAVTDLSN